MYYPLQIPYMLSKDFSEAVKYSEEMNADLNDFVMCFWEMQEITKEEKSIENIIVTDGCIDLVADFNHKQIGFVGMSKTNFEFTIQTPCKYFGIRMKPGTFHLLTGISATEAMDSFIPLNMFDSNFYTEEFFSLSFDDAKSFLKNYIIKLCAGKKPNNFITLFDELYDDIPENAESIYERIGFSPKQTQRLFSTHFGLTPKLVLSILRFQKCLHVLTSGKANPGDMLNLVNFYDQAHFINDFKRNLGITPFELVRRYTDIM
jgi:AraC-like DNA-binding protein